MSISTFPRLSVIVFAAGALSAVPALASINSNYSCGGAGVTFVVSIAPNGTAWMDGPTGRRDLYAQGPQVWRSADQETQFFADRALLYLGSEQFPCELMMADNERGGGQPGRSLGGRLRAGPGMDYAHVGSLAEGAPLTILGNSGVGMNGYDWFHVQLPDGRTAYQWGGIMCSDGHQVAGIFQMCGGGHGAVAPAAPAAGGRRGYMAFAVGNDGRYGHGASPSRDQAQNLALQYCGGGCRIEDVTDAQCHALAMVPGGMWFGAADNPRVAESYAMGFCQNAGARGCRIEYSYCQ